MATASAPGKVYLFGEHAVVYGEPAIPCAIDLRATVRAQTRDDGRVRVNAEDLTFDGVTVEYAGTGESRPDIDVPDTLIDAAFGYVETAIESARTLAGDAASGIDLTIDSEIPLGAGLGSSAAVTVATIDAVSRALGTEPDRTTIAQQAYHTERTVQDGRASRADTFCSTMGGAVRVEGDDCNRIDTPRLSFGIGYDGGSGDTAALVDAVRTRRDQYQVAASTVAAIGELVRRGESALITDDRATLGELMDMNHGLLSALGVSSRTLDDMVWAAREAGAPGAKLTGAGGGGCMVALEATDEVMTALRHAPSCEQSFATTLTTTGLRREAE